MRDPGVSSARSRRPPSLGRALLSIDYDDEAYGVTVDIEKSTSLAPGSWATSLEVLSDSGSSLRRREATPQSDGYYRVKVTSP